MAQANKSEIGSVQGLAPQVEAGEALVITPSKSRIAEADKERDNAYSCFTSEQKWGIISLISLASIFSYVRLS